MWSVQRRVQCSPSVGVNAAGTLIATTRLMVINMRIPQHLVSAIGLAACLALGTVGTATQAPSSGKTPLILENATVLEGVPAVRLDATREDATRRQLNGAEAAKERLTIDIVDGQYYWSSRESRPLTLTSSGEFTYLSSTEPGKYVRFRRINDRIAYVEHVDMAFGSVTYWGELRIVLGKQQVN